MNTGKKRKARLKRIGAIIDYYQPVFWLIHQELEKSAEFLRKPHSIRKSFWQLIPPGRYDSIWAQEVILRYRVTVEAELKRILSKHCFAYWLHAYRRLSPGPIGESREPATILWVRSILEAAVLKYSTTELCDGIGVSDEISESQILSGALVHPDFKVFLESARKSKQLVLTRFDISSMRELYEAEQLAYEIWKIGAALRITGKGAPLVVSDDLPYFFDDRSEELNALVEHYDERARPMESTASGTVFGKEFAVSVGMILVPRYDVGRVSREIFEKFLESFGYALDARLTANFVWLPLGLREYAKAHGPFAKAFESKHSIPLASVIAVIGALCFKTIETWGDSPSHLFQCWQRAYGGPARISDVEATIREYVPVAIRQLELGIEANSVDVSATMGFLGVNNDTRDRISVLLGGPHPVFIPFGKDRCFVDFAWLGEVLRTLFFGVNPPDQNFKGDALEEFVHRGKSVLPTKELKSHDGTSKQIDAAFEAGNLLVIVECKVKARSFGIETGDREALRQRKDLIDAALDQVDDKAKWLAKHPSGRNYDVTKFSGILPVGVTPFAEFIPSLKSHYWIRSGLPRVLSPNELRDALKNEDFTTAQNIVWLSKPIT